jgi:hypothetical protein
MYPLTVSVPHRTVSYRILPNRTVSDRIAPYRTVSDHIVLYCTVSYRIVSYRTVLYRIVPYRTVSYRIVPYRFVSYCTVFREGPFWSIAQRTVLFDSFPRFFRKSANCTVPKHEPFFVISMLKSLI